MEARRILTYCIMVNFLIQIKAIRVAIALYFNGFPSYDVSPSLKIAFTLTSSVNSDEMPHHVAFHLGLHCFV